MSSNQKTSRSLPIKTSPAYLVALAMFACATAPASADDAPPQTTLSASAAAEMALGEQSDLCREMNRGVREWKMQHHDCGLPFPSDNSDFSLLEWESLDPAQHEELISNIFYWHNALASREWDYSTFRELQLSRRHPDVNQNMKAKVWPPAREFVLKLIAEGRFELQRARTEMIPNGTDFWLYRMTAVWLNRNLHGDLAPPVVVFQESCPRGDIPATEPRYFYFAPSDEDIYAYFYFRKRGHDMVQYFLWRGQLFRFNRGQIFYFNPVLDSDRFGDFYLKRLCKLDIPKRELQ